MNAIEFCCPQGHKVKAKAPLAGKMVRCPACKSVMLVPERPRNFLKPREELTQSGVLRILGDAPPSPPMPEPSKQTHRNCPRCKKSLRVSQTICDHCQLYVGYHVLPPSRMAASDFEF